MFRSKLTTDSLNTYEGIFILMLMAIFGTELAVNYVLNAFLLRFEIFYASLINAAILVLLFAVPLWFFVVQPQPGKNTQEGTTARISSKALFSAVLACLFLIEFLVMMSLPSIMTQSDNQTINLTDACFTTLFSALPLWWLTCSRNRRRDKIPADDMLGAPLRLYALLLFAVFLTDLLMDILSTYMFSYVSHTSAVIINAFFSTLVIAPLLWWFVVRPLTKSSLLQKARANVVFTQAVEAFVTINEEGVIESFNPAAERIFGYNAEEIIGLAGAVLFDGNSLNLDDIILSSTESSSKADNILSHEASGRRRDGSMVTIDASISRILLDKRHEYLLIMRDISSRKKMEKDIKESEERYSLAVSGSNDGIWDWDILTDKAYYSPRFNELLGYQAYELDNTLASFTGNLHKEDYARVTEAVRTHIDKNVPYDIQYRLRTKTGNYRWFRARGQAARDESGRAIRMAGSISDINVQKEALEALRESEVRFRQIFEQSEDAIIFFKPHTSSVIDVNVTAENLFGFTKSELQKSGLKLITRPADYDFLSNSISNISRNNVTILEKIVNIRKDGTEIIVSMRGKVMTLKGVEIIYCTFRDVTERLRMEKEAQNIQAKLIQANKMTSLGLLVSGVAHEINNPNNFIMANSQLLERSWADALKILHEYYLENGEFYVGGVPFSELEAHSPKLFAGITDGSRRIESIINNLKNFARKDGSIERIDVNVNQVATSAISILHYELNKFTENFHVELAENIPLVKGSSQQLGQIIINLLMNACQALPSRQHGIWLTTSFDAAADQVIISVKDEGHGMSPEKSRMIMEPFFTTKLDSGGTGLGLSICQSITKDHSWCIDFASEQEKGSTFYVKIPVGAPVKKEQSA
jgi:PAS domain S-box-containing protein